MRKAIHAFLPKTVLYGPVPQVEGDDQAKHFQMQAFCFINCLQAVRGLQTSPSVHKDLLRSHVYWLGAALVCSWGELMVPWMPSETVGCCLVLSNDDQVLSSFFQFSLFSLLKLPPPKVVTLSLSTPHTICCSVFDPCSQGVSLFWMGTCY